MIHPEAQLRPRPTRIGTAAQIRVPVKQRSITAVLRSGKSVVAFGETDQWKTTGNAYPRLSALQVHGSR